ncbi:pirin family protein, partial [Acidithiobacillus ferrooxidans]|nr:pirin family protein [Acidithiobacillus ferrooxidans]
LYAYRGTLEIVGTPVSVQRMAILENGPETDGVDIKALTSARLLLIAGQPLHEPIVQYGPFVMNTREEIYQAFEDMKEGRLV